MATLYVSSSSTHSNENGTVNYPYKTISAAINAVVDNTTTLLLKCGDVFHVTESLNLHTKHISMNMYGDGSLPVLSGFNTIQFNSANLQRIQNTSKWRVVLPNSYDNVGFLYDRSSDHIVYGRRKEPGTSTPYSVLERQGDFTQVNNILFLYHDGDTFPYANLEVPANCSCFEFLSNCTVQNIRVEGFGIHGFSGISVNSAIRNVDIDLIGGCKADVNGFTRYGNGIEIWIAKEMTSTSHPHDVLVENCKISRTYDAGCTLQGEVKSNTRTSESAWNIVFSHNHISRCRQSFECFVRQFSSTGVIINNNYPVKNCRFEYNHCSDVGNNDFNSPEDRDCHLYGEAEGMKIIGNTFFGGGFRFRFYVPFGFSYLSLAGNLCILRKGETLIKNANQDGVGYHDNVKAEASSSMSIDDKIATYRSVVNDNNTVILVQ